MKPTRKTVTYRIGQHGSSVAKGRERILYHLDKLEKCDLSNKTFDVDIKPYVLNRSVRQNRYLWGVVYPTIIRYESGALFNESLEQEIAPLKVSKAEVVHEICKHKFLPKAKAIMPNGEVVLLNATTAKLNRVEFKQYIENVQMWAMQMFGAYVPDPNQHYGEPQPWWDAD